ncbi:UNVERIFIED_CONTAM: two-component system response regulator AtoC [Brevibacillus sp. OAP136]
MSTQHTVLIIDDEEQLCRIISHKLKKEGFGTIQVHNGHDAIQALTSETIDLILVDYMLPDMTGIELLLKIKEIKSDIPAIILTAYGNVENAVQAMKIGAVDYLCKPVELKTLVDAVKLAIPKRGRKNLQDPTAFSDIVFTSCKMKEIFDVLQKVMETDANILLLGESGVGKTAVARWIHHQSNRSDKPFVSINCAAIPESLMESELFGYRKGAFTGALETRGGKFALADKGSIFLDEIGEIPINTQAKLLHVIEEKRFMKLGSTSYESVDVRIIAATNKKIQELVKEKSFREDLYYRLSVVEVVIPPLREHVEDIPLLVQHYLHKLNNKYQKEIAIAKDACETLSSYPWPGNIRELINVLERLHILKRSGVIEKTDLVAHLNPIKTTRPVEPREQQSLPIMPEGEEGLHQLLEKVEGTIIQQALAKAGGNQTKAAEQLGISRHTLIYKLKKQKESARKDSE